VTAHSAHLPQTEPAISSRRRLLCGALVVALAFLTYLPALDNGFIADDWVILSRLPSIQENPLFLQTVPPENFRSTTYAVFGLLKGLFEYEAVFYYGFNIALHAFNSLLLFHLVHVLTRDFAASFLAALFLAVFGPPHEAVMWLAAMNETLQACFLFVAAILWTRERYIGAAVSFLFALFSKESAVIGLLIFPCVDLQLGRPVPRRCHAFLLLPLGVFAVLFVSSWSQNFMVGSGSYRLSWNALLVLAKSMHGLYWPALYFGILVYSLVRKTWPELPRLALFLLCAVPMLPYIFVAYSNRLSSRQVYLASAVFLALLASLIVPLGKSRLAAAFVATFVVVNIGHAWLRKDPEFERRAGPTEELLNIMKSEPPGPLRLEGLTPPYFWAARACTLAVAGWKPELIFSSHIPYPCPDCRTLYWEEGAGKWVWRE
jgi:hypothetical protein